MVKEFRVKKGYRVIITIVASLFCIAMLRDLYVYIDGNINSVNIQNYVIMAVCNLVLLYFAAILNKTKYYLDDVSLFVKTLLSKDKKYRLSEIELVEIIDDKFPCIRVYFSNDRKVTMMPIEHQTEFIEAVKNALKSAGKDWTFLK